MAIHGASEPHDEIRNITRRIGMMKPVGYILAYRSALWANDIDIDRGDTQRQPASSLYVERQCFSRCFVRSLGRLLSSQCHWLDKNRKKSSKKSKLVGLHYVDLYTIECIAMTYAAICFCSVYSVSSIGSRPSGAYPLICALKITKIKLNNNTDSECVDKLVNVNMWL